MQEIKLATCPSSSRLRVGAWGTVAVSALHTPCPQQLPTGSGFAGSGRWGRALGSRQEHATGSTREASRERVGRG